MMGPVGEHAGGGQCATDRSRAQEWCQWVGFGRAWRPSEGVDEADVLSADVDLLVYGNAAVFDRALRELKPNDGPQAAQACAES